MYGVTKTTTIKARLDDSSHLTFNGTELLDIKKLFELSDDRPIEINMSGAGIVLHLRLIHLDFDAQCNQSRPEVIADVEVTTTEQTQET